MSFEIRIMWECDRYSSERVELYAPKDGRAHGSLAAVLYVCADHSARATSPEWIGPITPHSTGAPVSRTVCGYLADYRDTTSSADKAPEAQDVAEPVQYELTMNGRTVPAGTLQEVQTAVAEKVTLRLSAAPDRLAEEAQAIHRAFAGGHVADELEQRGDWFTVFDAYGEHPLRIRVKRQS